MMNRQNGFGDREFSQRNRFTSYNATGRGKSLSQLYHSRTVEYNTDSIMHVQDSLFPEVAAHLENLCLLYYGFANYRIDLRGLERCSLET